MRTVAIAMTMLALAACGSGHDEGTTDEYVGDPCVSQDDCAELCVRDADYPDGICSLRCTSDDDCPTDTRCVQSEGGICLFECSGPDAFDCDFLGPAWRCNDKDAIGGGEVFVCDGP